MRQAVVLIHGIGEQRPMSTLRGFVDSVLRTQANPSRMFSKPDRMSETFEVRRLVVEVSRSRPTTDFYEYYWAHHMEGTRLRHLWPWIRTILLRSPLKVPRQLLLLWVVSWLLAGGAAFGFVGSRVWSDEWLSTGAWASLVLAVLFAVVQSFAIGWLGDAARYLSPLPGNIAVRQKIRAEGIQLLRRLHQGGNYDRIVLVGHSLGSVIGLDVLTHLWNQFNTSHPEPDRAPEPALATVEKLGRQLSEKSAPADVQLFRDAQRELWLEQRLLGFPWLVTDFVTLGSPLAHAAILIAKDQDDLRTRKEDRELPTCPPVEDENRYSYVQDYVYQGQPRGIRVLHHAALFAQTRWSNVYFPLRLGLLGDIVGGPLRPVFGPGILDTPVTEGLVRFAPLLPHTHYWRGALDARADRTSALAALRTVLDLNSSGWLPRT